MFDVLFGICNDLAVIRLILCFRRFLRENKNIDVSIKICKKPINIVRLHAEPQYCIISDLAIWWYRNTVLFKTVYSADFTVAIVTG